jgi:hypothetical protein
LIEVLDMDGLAEAIRTGDLGSRKPHPLAVASRHWYKTACVSTKDVSYDDPLVPVGLPGFFSVRGDWFLTVAGGSRSERLAKLALDVLNSRRGNYERLRLGLGLPTRRILDEDARLYWAREDSLEEPNLRTSILTAGRRREAQNEPDEKSRRRLTHVRYHELLKLGGPCREADEKKFPHEQDFHWLWRSRLKYFHRHALIWQEWVNEMLLWWKYMRDVNQEKWVNGFLRYDLMEQVQTRMMQNQRRRKPKNKEDIYSSIEDGDNEARLKFERRCESLSDQLRQATPIESPVTNTLPA